MSGPMRMSSEVCKSLKKESSTESVPIIMLTAKGPRQRSRARLNDNLTFCSFLLNTHFSSLHTNMDGHRLQGGNTQGDGSSVTIQTIPGRSGVKHILLLLAIVATVVGGIATDGAAEEKEQKLRFWGDLRGRFEAFRFSEDETGADKEDRRRIRYRLRISRVTGASGRFSSAGCRCLLSGRTPKTSCSGITTSTRPVRAPRSA